MPQGEIIVGYLSKFKFDYCFTYSAEFKASGLPAVPGFYDLDKIYESRALWPFFTVRIPPINRPDVEAIIIAKKIDVSDPMDLLLCLGHRSITSPYLIREFDF
jgi:hypothetical protein